MKIRDVNIANVTIGSGHPLAIIAGPCVIETEKNAIKHAQMLKKICQNAGIPLIFKSSYDKANRSSLSSFRGPGLKSGLSILKRIKKELGLPVLSDVHSVEEVHEAAQVLDCLQIPAFLCRQTDLLLAAAKTKKPVNVKKGQFLAPWNMLEVIKKIESQGNHRILLTERGATFGYNNLVVDFRNLRIMRELGYPVIFDATHSVQLPGAMGSSSGGERKYITALSRAAVAFGCDGLFLEVHEDPDAALCDGPNTLSLKEFKELLKVIVDLDKLSLKNNFR